MYYRNQQTLGILNTKPTVIRQYDDIFNHYPGGKNVNGTYQKIINLIPPHDIYVEGCVGGGAILQRKRPASITIANDCDPQIYAAWIKYMMDGLEARNIDVLELIDELVVMVFAGERIFLYLDPPYPKETRSTNKQIYLFDSTPELHKSILSGIIKVNYNCMISTYPNKLYKDVLGSDPDWYLYEYESTTRGSVKTEQLWMNYPQPTELHDYQYLGKDCWDRQRIKRKINTKIATLLKLPVLERQAIIQGVLLKLNQIQ